MSGLDMQFTVGKPHQFSHYDFISVVTLHFKYIQPKGSDDICLMFVPVTGWTEHLQFMLHTAHRVLKIDQPECEVQQRQEP
jgi:hypothetical protein